MDQAYLEFVCACIAAALLGEYGIDQPPVPVREILSSPPRDLRHDLSLTEGLPFAEALWLRLLGGQGVVFANPDLPEPQRRYAMACALFTGLCSSAGGLAAGLPSVPNDERPAQAALFARCLLMPVDLLPAGWAAMSPEELAGLFSVPPSVARTRLEELARIETQPRHCQ